MEYEHKLYAYKSIDYQVVYMDESGFGYDMPRLFAYNYKGARAIGYRENHNKRKTNLIGALLNNELIAPSFHESNITSDIVFSWVKTTLLPALKRKTVLIMDNASFHKRKDILELMSDAGHMVLYLPPYSPELNPIEKHWAMLKSKVRKLRLHITDIIKPKKTFRFKHI